MRRKILVLVCLLVIALMVVSTVPVGAKKPPKDPPDGDSGPTGTIFYMQIEDGVGSSIWSMDADGTDKTEVTDIVSGLEGKMSISLEKHDGDHYWYVYFVRTTNTHPDGKSQTQMWAIRDDNTMGFQMTDDENMAFPTTNWGGQPKWVPGDDSISWVASYWTPVTGGSPTQGSYGIYTAEVEYDISGNVAGLGDPSFDYDAGYYHYSTETEDLYYPDVRGYDWSPDLDEIVFQRTGGYIYIDSVPESSSPTQLVQGYGPKWSPDGTMIAFGRSHEISVINVDGTGEVNLVTVKNTKGAFKNVWAYHWSPDSEYLVFTIYERNRHTWASKTTIYTIEPDGTGKSAISGLSIGVWKYSRDWR